MVDCKKCENFAELKISDNNDTLYVCLADQLFRDEYDNGFIYLLDPTIFNDIISDCTNFKVKTK